MSGGVSEAKLIARAFTFGFFMGAATLALLTSDYVDESSSSSFSLRNNNNAGGGAAPRYNRSGLLAGYADPQSVSLKPITTEAIATDGSLLLPRQEKGEQLTRHVHVGSMCRCPSGQRPAPGPLAAADEYDTGIVQPPSLATGNQAKRFVMHGSEGGCSCVKNGRRTPYAEETTDLFLKHMELHQCPRPHQSQYDWDNMPDLGVEEGLPVFLGVLSYESPLSLNGTLHNWLDHDLFRRTQAQEAFVRLNHRSPMDDEILQKFEETQLSRHGESPVTVLGSPSENLHPGLAIADMCRRAESHPSSHPNGENLLMFLEKDWSLYNGPGDLPAEGFEQLLRGVNALAQRGVPYIHLKRRSNEVSSEKTWPCPSQGFPFECTTAHQHRWTNQPMVVRCDWFLRYMEPFALLDDPIMYGCRPGFQEARYCDWEEALQDGRIAWAETQWVAAHLMTGKHRLFFHEEVDQ